MFNDSAVMIGTLDWVEIPKSAKLIPASEFTVFFFFVLGAFDDKARRLDMVALKVRKNFYAI